MPQSLGHGVVGRIRLVSQEIRSFVHQLADKGVKVQLFILHTGEKGTVQQLRLPFRQESEDMMMFQGYDQQTVDFLWGIRFNNDRSWFQDHKEQYQTHLLAPTRALGEQLYDGLHAMLPHEPLILKVSRIYRDARRLHGQGPYKDHLWLCVRTGDQDWTGRPTFYFEIAPDYYSYGMGFWCAAPALMALYRQRIDADPKPLEKLVRRFDRQQTFRLPSPALR